jgi:hypothetical protein
MAKLEFESEYRELVVLREKNPNGAQPAYVIPELIDLAQNLYFERIKLLKAGKDPRVASAFMRYVARAQKANIINESAAQRLANDYDALSNGMIGLLPFESAHQAHTYYQHLNNRMAEAKMPPPMPQSKSHLCRSLADPKWEDSWVVCDEKNEPGFTSAMKSKYPQDSSYKLAAFKWLIAISIAAGTAASIFFTLATGLVPALLITAAIGAVVFLEKWNGNHSRLNLVARNLSRTFSGLYHHTRQWNIKDILLSLGLIGTVVLMLGLTAQGLILKSIPIMGVIGAALFGVGSMVHNGSSLLDGARKLLEKLFGSFQFGFRSLRADAQLHTKEMTENFHLVYSTETSVKQAEASMLADMRVLAKDMRTYLTQSLPSGVSGASPGASVASTDAAENSVSDLLQAVFDKSHLICYQLSDGQRDGNPASLNTCDLNKKESQLQVTSPSLRVH